MMCIFRIWVFNPQNIMLCIFRIRPPGTAGAGILVLVARPRPPAASSPKRVERAAKGRESRRKVHDPHANRLDDGARFFRVTTNVCSAHVVVIEKRGLSS
jgi:hypothetical protein